MPPNKYPNFRSEFLISANNKQFKIKRNPLFKKIAKEMGIEISSNKDNKIGRHDTNDNIT